jgi:hypothetical protein
MNGDIRITREEALSRRVDELLQRQRNLRGERGVLVERRPPWYLRNWLLLSLAGLLGAVTAWAVLEPHFEDVLYVQGPVASFDGEGTVREIEGASLRFPYAIVVRGDTILVGADVPALARDGSRAPLDPAALAPGREIGVYAEYHDGRPVGVGVAHSVVVEPGSAPDKARLPLATLSRRSGIAGLVLFPLVAGLVGLAIGAADGIVCRRPGRAFLCGGVGLVVGLVGGLFSGLVASVVYMPLSALAAHQTSEGSMTAFGFMLQVMGRTLAWAMAGLAMGLGQGIALRSHRLLAFGVLGGVVGGLVGGLLFDPIDLVLVGDGTSAHLARLVGLAVIGAGVGAMIGVVELLARDAWLRMSEGPLAGKEFLIYRDVMTIGAAPSSDIYLFNDPRVAQRHATLRSVGEDHELENHDPRNPATVNGRAVERSRLHPNDQIGIGRAVFVYQRRQAA